VGVVGTTVAFAMRSSEPGDEEEPAVSTAAIDRAAVEQSEPQPSEAEPASTQEATDPPLDGPIPMEIEVHEGADDGDALPEPEPEPEPEPDATSEVDEDAGGEDESESRGSDANAVYVALREGKMRALDLLLVAPEPVKKWRRRSIVRKMSFDDGHRYCEELEIEGVGGWRLATIGELGSLTEGRILDRGKFWSSTKADSLGRTRVVWNSATGKMGPAPTNWRGGRVVCVRPSVRPTTAVLEPDDED
jgi:hypothetical protein